MMVPRPLPTAPLDPTNHKTLISIAPPPLCIDLAALVASTYVIPFKYQSQCCNNVTMMIMMKMTTKILTTTTTNDKSLSVYPKLEISAVMKTTASTVTLDCKTHFFSTQLTRNKNYLLSTKAAGAPIGMPTEVMMTMTTLLADPTSPQRSLTQKSIDKCSSTPKASTVANSNIHCIETASYTPPTVLCPIPTGKFQKTAANAAIGLPADNDIRYPSAIECIVNALSPTNLQEWEEFFNKFNNSTTYALAHSIDAINASLVIDDNDCSMNKCSNNTPSTNDSFYDSICQLRHAVGELEKVNYQLFQLLEALETPDPTTPTL